MNVEDEEENVFEDKVEVGTRLSEVRFSAVTEEQIDKENYGIVEIAMYEDAYKDYILNQIKEEFTQETKVVESNYLGVENNMCVKVVLSAKNIEIEEDEIELRWKGKYLKFSFDYCVPKDYDKKRILFRADVYFDNIIATKLKFTVDISSESGRGIPVERRDINKAFVSYASQDRVRVSAILQGIRKARPDMDVFFDVETLRSGEDWEKKLYQELLNRDVLFLCWSHFAKESKWVEREWKYVLEHKGLDAIEPVPMEDPIFCPPPEELQNKHFNDLEVQMRKQSVKLEDVEW